MAASSFSVGETDFLLSDVPFRLIGGAMHYFRVHPSSWRDRLRKMRMMGVNTLDTYIAWNLHEPRQGEFKFDGWLDIVKYIKVADEEGLKVVVRPGPYICAEWDLGGQPAWLLKDPDMKFRCSYKPFLERTAQFFKELLPRLAPLQIHRGGPIIMVQLENEYGTFGDDQEYLQSLCSMLVEGGIEVPLFTCDWARDEELQKGSVDGVFMAINFDKNPLKKFAKLREYQKRGPIMVAEYWVGWFDQWGGRHANKPSGEVVECLGEMLGANASFTMYLFHGGTNFGFTSGANHYEEFQPTITSYDYDNPLSEAGDITPKYLAIRGLLSQYATLPPDPLPANAPKLALPPFPLHQSATLRSSLPLLSAPSQHPAPLSMEALDQADGFILYRTTVRARAGATANMKSSLRITGMRDRAHVITDGHVIGIIDYHNPDAAVTIPAPTVTGSGPGEIELEILVENMGRVNFGPHMLDRKGITGSVLLDGRELTDWTIFPLPLDDVSQLRFETAASPQPLSFFRSTFHITSPLDTFLALPGFTKGVAWVNNFNLGRYWSIGPQQTLYVPAAVLREGENELVVLELDGGTSLEVELRDTPQLETKREESCALL